MIDAKAKRTLLLDTLTEAHRIDPNTTANILARLIDRVGRVADNGGRAFGGNVKSWWVEGAVRMWAQELLDEAHKTALAKVLESQQEVAEWAKEEL